MKIDDINALLFALGILGGMVTFLAWVEKDEIIRWLKKWK
jgi:hypothetical protein